MCVPAMGLIGGLLSGVGSIMGAMASANAANAQAQVYERQAQIERQKGEYESARRFEQNQKILGRQRAAYLASGVSLQGSPGDIIIDSAQEGMLDVQAIKWNSTVRAQNFEYSAKIERMNASNAMTGGFIGALAPIVSSVGRASSGVTTIGGYQGFG